MGCGALQVTPIVTGAALAAYARRGFTRGRTLKERSRGNRKHRLRHSPLLP